MECCWSHKARYFGVTSIEASERACRGVLNTDLQDLSPLTVLRDARSVSVVGRVTGEWGQHLRMSMDSSEGGELDEF